MDHELRTLALADAPAGAGGDAKLPAPEWRETFDAIGDAIFLLDSENRIQHCNEAGRGLLGKPLKEIIGSSCWELVHGTHGPLDRCPYLQARKTHQRETVQIRRNGRWLDLSVDPLFDEAENLVGAVHVISDVTERKESEEALRRSQQELSIRNRIAEIFLTVSHGEVFPRVEEVIREETQSAHGTLGYVGRDRALVCPSLTVAAKGKTRSGDTSKVLQHETARLVWERVLASKDVLLTDEPVSGPAGGRPPSRSLVVPIVHRGEAIGVLAVGNKPKPYDGDDRRRLETISDYIAPILHARLQSDQREDALQKQLQHIRLLNQMGRAIAERQDIASVSLELLTQLQGKLPIDFGAILLFGSDTENVTFSSCTPQNGAGGKRSTDADAHVVPLGRACLKACADGKRFYVPDLSGLDAPYFKAMFREGLRSVMAVPLILDAHVMGILVTGRKKAGGFDSSDETFLLSLGEQVALVAHQAQLLADLKGAYDELKETQQAVMQQERLRALGQMASGIAHDINNALTPVLGFSELLLMGTIGLEDKGRVTTCLETINTAAQDIACLVGRLREFYRPREETDVLLPIDLNQVVRQAITLTQPKWKGQAQAAGTTVTIKTDLKPLPLIPADDVELREILTNLIFNAVDAMPRGGVITLRTRRDGERVRLDVEDTGIGMPEKIRQRCLEPFFSTKGEHGTGLGLGVVYGVVKRHGGTIDIRSELGRGSAFSVYLPVRSGGPTRTEEVVAISALARKVHVLLVDDEPSVLEVMSHYLLADGHTLETASNGPEALKKFAAGRFDLVVTDRAMPGMNGDQLAASIKEAQPEEPIILLSGFGEMMKAAGEEPPHIDLVVSKPVKMNELRAAMVQVTSRNELSTARN